MSVSRTRSPCIALPALLVLCSLALGCKEATTSSADAGSDAGGQTPLRLSREELMKPETCQGCHPRHYRDWASSMHAYAARDPVFIAMNQRGQRETKGELGDFCVRCHAPMAVREGETHDGLNLAQLKPELKGVTCYFCHAAVSHGALENNTVELSDDGLMRGPVRNAIDPTVHGVVYSNIHDPASPTSSALCGSCHDVKLTSGVHLERTHLEYTGTIFGMPGGAFQSCQSCHMRPLPYDAPIAVMPGQALPDRKLHSHLWPGVDVALDPDFPDQQVQHNAVMCELINSINIGTLRADDPIGMRFTVSVETGAGHSQPSGSAQDRRLWIEAIGYDAAGKVMFESGQVADDEVEEQPMGSPGYDPSLAMMRDHIFDAQGNEVHMFWEAAPSTKVPKGYRGNLLLGPTPSNLHNSQDFRYAAPGPVARFTLRLRMRPVGMDIMHSLVDSGDLDPAVLSKMPTFTLGEATWKAGDGTREIKFERPDLRCPQAYLCELDPGAKICD
jgi:hypothetical protein